MIRVKIYEHTTWVPPICHVCEKSVGHEYFIKESGPLCAVCEGKLRKAKKKRKKKKK